MREKVKVEDSKNPSKRMYEPLGITNGSPGLKGFRKHVFECLSFTTNILACN